MLRGCVTLSAPKNNFHRCNVPLKSTKRQHLFHAARPRTLIPQSTTSSESIPAEEEEKEVEDPATTAFAALYSSVSSSSSPTSVQLLSGPNGRGLFTTREFSGPGLIILSVPLTACLLVDYSPGSNGVQLPAQGDWPRVKRGLSKDDALPWDIILSLALLDGLAGDGDAFWSRYTNDILPPPQSLSLPVCLPKSSLLQELHHPAIIEAALAQKQRLTTLFPGLAAPMKVGDDEEEEEEEGVSYFEWAFACVRSRAFQIHKDAFAFVPFLDAANHAGQPNADFQLSSDGSTIHLVTVQQIQPTEAAGAGAGAGEEVTISYTGAPGGYTNQRMMQQYGFVLPQGNPHDRITFECLEQYSKKDGEKNKVGPLLSLDALQSALGDDTSVVDAFSGRDTYMYAALKSLPLAVIESDAASVVDQLALAAQLLAEIEEERKGWKTSAAEDAATLVALLERREGVVENDEKGKKGGLKVDERLVAVIRYRLQRKRLLDAASRVLNAFMHR